jgi:catechol 2,3-dioxygenase-like lactoylglutathione lyase family enzyme
MVKTRGLTHIALGVRNLKRSSAFYQRVIGGVEVYRGSDFVQLQTPGSWDVIVLEKHTRKVGPPRGILHFGFRLVRPADIRQAIEDVRAAGGEVVETGEFVPGEPYLFAKDPDGYLFEIWYELPTKVDPRRSRTARRS